MTAAGGSSAAGLPREFFGMHFHRIVLQPGEQAMSTEWPDIGIGAIRLWDSVTAWSDLAPSPGAWNFERMDQYLQQAAGRGAKVLYTLGSTPRWASSRPDEHCSYGTGCAAEPVKMAHWEEYVRRVAQRYRGRIEAYELWNEPDFSDFERDRESHAYYSGSVAAMVEMARIARAVLASEDPGAKLLGPGFVNGPHRLELFLSQGGGRYIDGVAYHLYSANARRLLEQMHEVRLIMSRQGLGGLPLWSTEAGVESYPPGVTPPPGAGELLTETAAAERMAQLLIAAAANGLDRYYYYAWDNDRSGMVDRWRNSRPRRSAYEQVHAWLLGCVFLAPERSADATGWTVQARRGAERFMFAWTDTGSDHRVSLPAGRTVRGVECLDTSGGSALVGASVGPARPLHVGPSEMTLSGAVCRISLAGQARSAGTATKLATP